MLIFEKGVVRDAYFSMGAYFWMGAYFPVNTVTDEGMDLGPKVKFQAPLKCNRISSKVHFCQGKPILYSLAYLSIEHLKGGHKRIIAVLCLKAIQMQPEAVH